MTTATGECKVQFFDGDEIEGGTAGQFFAIITFHDGFKFQMMWDVAEAVEIRRIMTSDEAQDFVAELGQFALKQRLDELGLGKKVKVVGGTACPSAKPQGTA